VQHTEAKQSGHTLRTEEADYGRHYSEPPSPFQTLVKRQQFKFTSSDWREILELTLSMGRQ
jgi:hypothetical protein